MDVNATSKREAVMAIRNQAEQLHVNMLKCLKVPIQRWTEGKEDKRINSFKEELEQTFKLWPRHAMQQIKNKEDRLFLESMMSDRKMSMAGVDKKLTTTEKNAEEALASEMQRRQKAQQYKEVASATCQLADSDDNNSDNDKGDTTTEATGKRGHKRKVKTGVTIFLPHDVLKKPKVVQTLIRNKISSAAISQVIKDIVESADADPNKLSLSYATTE